MSLSDCEKCWDTPCSCGWHWRDYSPAALANFIVSVVSEHHLGKQLTILCLALEKVQIKYEAQMDAASHGSNRSGS